MACQRYGLAYRMIYLIPRVACSQRPLHIPNYSIIGLPTIEYISHNKKDLRFLASP